MIRRDCLLSDGTEGWTLISQVEHARLAGVLAEAWQLEPAGDLEPAREEISGAVFHHDDGWPIWEANPKVDTDSGQPLEFTEMPVTDSLSIWARSIERCETLGPLAAYMVAGHFCYLLKRSDAWDAGNQDADAAHAWAERFAERQRDWLREWTRADEPFTPELAQTALEWLQGFDALSLWFCCAERTEPLETQIAGGPAVKFSPAGGSEIQTSPWPFGDAPLVVQACGQRLKAHEFSDSRAFLAAETEPIELIWRLTG